MTPDDQIMHFLQTVNYTCMFITSSGKPTKCGLGEQAWREMLVEMNGECKAALVVRMKMWNEK